jgi:hypothetical protein
MTCQMTCIDRFAAEDIKAGEWVWASKAPNDDEAQPGAPPSLNFYRTIDQINQMPEVHYTHTHTHTHTQHSLSLSLH